MIFFFFKQKTAYEMQRGLVGSEMCIRDRRRVHGNAEQYYQKLDEENISLAAENKRIQLTIDSLLSEMEEYRTTNDQQLQEYNILKDAFEKEQRNAQRLSLIHI
eukprot:TRINITY_DN24033_c0_g1_i2.p3 TRINITY_DN24033_c0_g1~~TRINITY_DN24033_c0_g1_i2.p3  ORF type:complete len:104 (+),score=45.76 TRINITY_DN24033_c0_g1_i2:2-313(+)